MRTKKPMKHNLRVIAQEAKKMWRIWWTYKILIVFWAIFPLLWVLPFVFQGRAMVGGLSSANFKILTGTEQYLPYILIGAMISTYVFSGIWGVGNSLREETYWGTLEYIIISPTSPIIILVGKILSEFVYATATVCFQASICILLFGLEITVVKIAPILLIVFLLLIAFYSFAIAFAGLTLLIKETHGLVRSFEWIFYLFSPIRYPVEINPITKFVSMFIPLTYALIAIRMIILASKPGYSFWNLVFILLIMDVVATVFGYIIFTKLELRTRKAGTIGMH